MATSYRGDYSISLNRPRTSHTQTTSTSTIRRLPGSVRSVDQRPATLPTPPASNRPSLEESTAIPTNTNAVRQDQKRVEFVPPVSPPASPPRAGKLTRDDIAAKVKLVTEGVEETCTIEGVAQTLFDQFNGWAQDHLPGWEGLRIDLHNDILVVGCPLSFGHEIIAHILDQLRAQGHSFPDVCEGKEAFIGGSADVRLSGGRKQPDCAIYVDGDGEDELNEPTIAFEVGYSEDATKLTLDAARLLCLTTGLIQLVVTIKITHQPRKSREPRVLQSVTWDHWEHGGTRMVKPEESHKLNDPKPTALDQAGIPTAYVAVAEIDKGDRCQLLARKVGSYTIFPENPNNKDGAIRILNRHLYRNPAEGAKESVAMSVPYTIVRRVILKHEERQRRIDDEAAKVLKRKRTDDDERKANHYRKLRIKADVELELEAFIPLPDRRADIPDN